MATFSAIAVAALVLPPPVSPASTITSPGLNPPVILLVTFLFSVLEKGSSVVQSSFGLSSDCADVLQGIILFFILGCELFIRYQFVFRGKGGTRA